MNKISKESQYILDIILPKNFRPSRNLPTNEEASVLFSLWKRCPGDLVFALNENEKKFMNAWKAKGLVSGMSDSLQLTDKGKHIIVEMVTNEPNSFDKNATSKKYSDIVEAKKTHNEKLTKKAFNLKEERMKRNAGKDNQQSKKEGD